MQSHSSSWRALLADPGPSAHVVQFYDHDAFLASAVAHYAAEGLRRNEAVLLNGTPGHMRAIVQTLASRDIDTGLAVRRGQLVMLDVNDGLGCGGTARIDDAALLEGLHGATAQARAAGFVGARWWGELANLLYQRGDHEAAIRVECVATEATARLGASIFCSFLADRFDAGGYDGLHDMCSTHSHVIPAEDYAGHRVAVNRAIAEVVGDLRGAVLQSLSSWRGLACDVPSSQAVLFWLRETMPERFAEVLAHARAHQQAPA